MPRGDGTGPRGQGPFTGRGANRGRLGRMGGPVAGGPAGKCVCPNCGFEQEHSAGIPCNKIKCPKCGSFMTRKV